MKKLSTYPKIKKAKKIYDEAIYKIYVCDEKCDRAMSASGCWECDVFHSKYEGREMSERFSFCTGCKHERKMLNVKQERIEASNKTKLMRKEYAKAVFEILSKERPKLYCRLEKKNIEWDKAFPSTFDDVQEGLYVALVALAEDSIGRYSFAQ